MIKNIFLGIFIIFVFSACEQGLKIVPSGKTVEVGVLSPLTGKDKRLGQQGLIGLEAARKMRKYLNNGDEVVLKVIDTKSNVKNAKNALATLALADVKSVFSLMSSMEMTSLSREIYYAKLPIISTIATNNHIAKENSYVTQVCMNNSTQVIVASHYIRDEKFVHNVGVVYNKSSDYSQDLAEEFKKYYLTLGGSIDFFIDISVPKGLKEFQEHSKKGISMLFNATDAKITAKLLNLLKSQKSKCKILGTDGLFSGALELSKEDLKLFDGVYVIEHYAHDVGRNQSRKKFEMLISEDAYKESTYALLSYDGYQLLMNALNSCPDYNKKCIQNTLQNSSNIKGISSIFTIVDAKAKREVYVNKIHNSLLIKEVVIY